jgi:hypothetical protein
MAINTATVQEFIDSQRAPVYMLFHTYFIRNQPFLLRSDLIDGFTEFCATGHGRVLKGSVLGEAIELTRTSGDGRSSGSTLRHSSSSGFQSPAIRRSRSL